MILMQTFWKLSQNFRDSCKSQIFSWHPKNGPPNIGCTPSTEKLCINCSLCQYQMGHSENQLIFNFYFKQRLLRSSPKWKFLFAILSEEAQVHCTSFSSCQSVKTLKASYWNMSFEILQFLEKMEYFKCFSIFAVAKIFLNFKKISKKEKWFENDLTRMGSSFWEKWRHLRIFKRSK